MKSKLTWDDVREISADELAIGNRWVVPGTGIGYHVHSDGSVSGAGWTPLDGVVWSLVEREGCRVVARNVDGEEVPAEVPAGARVLMIRRPAGRVTHTGTRVSLQGVVSVDRSCHSGVTQGTHGGSYGRREP